MLGTLPSREGGDKGSKWIPVLLARGHATGVAVACVSVSAAAHTKCRVDVLQCRGLLLPQPLPHVHTTTTWHAIGVATRPPPLPPHHVTSPYSAHVLSQLHMHARAPPRNS